MSCYRKVCSIAPLYKRTSVPSGLLARIPWPPSIPHGLLQQQKRHLTISELDAAKGNRERVLILGSGWGGFGLARKLDPRYYQPVIISPRNYFVFTPLLASSAVGTLEPRVTMEMVRGGDGGALFRAGRKFGLGREENEAELGTSKTEFYQAWAEEVDLKHKKVLVEEAFGAKTAGLAGTGLREGVRSGTEEGGVVSLKVGGGNVGEEVGSKVVRTGRMFKVGYDKLVVAVGCYSQTFGVKGVKEHAWFLKDVGDARGIRRRILECFEIASLPTTTPQQRDQLLHFAVVGGGPTGIEFSAELHDLIADDLPRQYPTLTPHVRITVYDVSSRILSMFDASLAHYAERTFARQNITIKTEHHVLEVRPGPVLVTKEEGEVPVGMVVWSTGIAVGPFVKRLTSGEFDLGENGQDSGETGGGWRVMKDPRAGRVCVDERLRVRMYKDHPDGTREEKILPDVFAMGDCAYVSPQNSATASTTSTAPTTTPPAQNDLPATAQVANQQAIYLRNTLNAAAASSSSSAHHVPSTLIDITPYPPFRFKNAGIMAYIGGWRAITQFPGSENVKGRLAWVLWRTAYLSMSVGWRNRILIPVYWAVNWLFGRDLNRY